MKFRLMTLAVLCLTTLSVATLSGPFFGAYISAGPAHAGETVQTMIFAIENMTCALCPITVRKTMEQVEGVKSVTVDFDAKTAVVLFDPATTTPVEIGKASTNAGYPARVLGTNVE